MKKIIKNSSGHIIADFDGRRMLLDTGAAKTFYDEFSGVRVSDLSRMLDAQIDGVIGMDSLEGKIVSLTRDTVHINGEAPDRDGAPLTFISGLPCVDIKINNTPCRAAIRTGATASYISEALISKDKHTRFADDYHPLYGRFKVKMFVNYFSVSNKHYFTDAAELPEAFSLPATADIDAVIGTDLLKRFNMVIDFSSNRFHLLSC